MGGYHRVRLFCVSARGVSCRRGQGCITKAVGGSVYCKHSLRRCALSIVNYWFIFGCILQRSYLIAPAPISFGETTVHESCPSGADAFRGCLSVRATVLVLRHQLGLQGRWRSLASLCRRPLARRGGMSNCLWARVSGVSDGRATNRHQCFIGMHSCNRSGGAVHPIGMLVSVPASVG
jgi:hypothetical protein